MTLRVRAILVIAALLVLTFFIDRWRRTRVESSQDKNILAAGQRHGVDAALVKAVVWRESRFDPRARGSKGEIGLMQIMPDAAGADWASAQRLAAFSDTVLFDPARNIDCGTWYLRGLLGRYQNTDDPVPYALAAYNAGSGNARKWMVGAASTNSATFIDQIAFPSTRAYVHAVMKKRAQYSAWAAKHREKRG